MNFNHHPSVLAHTPINITMTHTMDSFGTSAMPEGPDSQSRRQRISMACQYCRHRKIRCCGGAPCRNCMRSQKACEYAPVPEEVNRATREKKAVAKAVKHTTPNIHYSPYFVDQPVFEVPSRLQMGGHRRTVSTPNYFLEPPPSFATDPPLPTHAQQPQTSRLHSHSMPQPQSHPHPHSHGHAHSQSQPPPLPQSQSQPQPLSPVQPQVQWLAPYPSVLEQPQQSLTTSYSTPNFSHSYMRPTHITTTPIITDTATPSSYYTPSFNTPTVPASPQFYGYDYSPNPYASAQQQPSPVFHDTSKVVGLGIGVPQEVYHTPPQEGLPQAPYHTPPQDVYHTPAMLSDQYFVSQTY